jgi:hypothetical protein
VSVSGTLKEVGAPKATLIEGTMVSILAPTNALTVIRGSSKTLQLTVKDSDTNEAVDLTGATVYFTVKSAIGDEQSLIQKISTNVAQIELTAPREGKASIKLVPADTMTKDPGSYTFDVWAVLASGVRIVPVPPTTLEIEQSVTVIP